MGGTPDWGGSVSPAGGGGVPQSSQGGSRWGILRPLAGGMPLAFTQEDFLVIEFGLTRSHGPDEINSSVRVSVCNNSKLMYLRFVYYKNLTTKNDDFTRNILIIILRSENYYLRIQVRKC